MNRKLLGALSSAHSKVLALPDSEYSTRYSFDVDAKTRISFSKQSLDVEFRLDNGSWRIVFELWRDTRVAYLGAPERDRCLNARLSSVATWLYNYYCCALGGNKEPYVYYPIQLVSDGNVMRFEEHTTLGNVVQFSPALMANYPVHWTEHKFRNGHHHYTVSYVPLAKDWYTQYSEQYCPGIFLDFDNSGLYCITATQFLEAQEWRRHYANN